METCTISFTPRLEGVFNISTHILSRIPGATATQYKEIAIKLGENKIIDNDFAINKMTKWLNIEIDWYIFILKLQQLSYIKS